ncbi:MAG: glycerophosphodiester phosphodiesterase, partial [Candidatus Bipolaricaulaceae bacterium]
AWPLVVAHRGGGALAPENTLAAARAAAAAGADGWEFDVQLTKDGEAILMHDESLARTTNARDVFPGRAPRRVEDFTLEEIKRLDAGSWFLARDPFGTLAGGQVPGELSTAFRGEPVPTLREALLATRELGLLADVELKGSLAAFALSGRQRSLVQRTVAVIDELGMTDRVLVSSFAGEMIGYVKELAPTITAAPIVIFPPQDLRGYLDRLGADGVAVSTMGFSPQAAAALAEAGYQVYVWTVNDPAPLRRYAGLDGLAGIITDWPHRLVGILTARGD